MNIDITKYLKNKDVKITNDDFDFKIMQIIDESSYLYYDEIRNKMYKSFE